MHNAGIVRILRRFTSKTKIFNDYPVLLRNRNSFAFATFSCLLAFFPASSSRIKFGNSTLEGTCNLAVLTVIVFFSCSFSNVPDVYGWKIDVSLPLILM